MNTIPKPADRGEWLRARHPYFNASDAAALYDAHPYKTLADVAVEKLMPEPVDGGTSAAMERGVRLEPFLLEWFGDTHGVEVVTPDVLFVNGPVMATLDGVFSGGDDEWIEAKTTAQRWDEVPVHVYWQVVAQAAASGRSSCWVVWIDSDMQFKEQLVQVGKGEVDDLLDRARTVMDHIGMGMMPEGVDLGARHLATLYPSPEPGSYSEVDDEGLSAIVEWEQARQARIEAEKIEAAAKDAAARVIGENEGARYDGRVIATWKANKASVRPDWKALEADHPDLVVQYRREVPGPRVLRVTKELGL